MKIYLDFETRSEVDIKKSGAWVYATHPSTDVLCVAYATDDEEINVAYKENGGFNIDISFDSGTLFISHYSMFEYYIWNEILAKRYGFPRIPQRQWRCTAAKVAVLALPRSLDKAAEALDMEVKKDLEGKKLMLKMCKPRKPTKAEKLSGVDTVLWHETNEDLERLEEYCKIDVEVERVIDKTVPDLIPYEQEVWFLDQEINRRGLKIDVEAVDAALDLIKQYKKEKIAEVVELSDGFLDEVSKRQKVLTWLKGLGVNLPDYTKETVNKVLSGRIPSVARKVLKIRQELGRTSVAKYEAFKKATDIHQIMCDTLIYHGASTGRWTAKNVQPHNFPRGSIQDIASCIELMKRQDLEIFRMFYPKVMAAISSCIRGMLIARPDHEFYVGDYNAI